MKFTFLVFLLIIIFNSGAQSQDLITTLKGEEVNAKVVEVTASKVIYLVADSILTKPASEIFKIRFANGTKKVFNTPLAAPTPSLSSGQIQQIYYDSLYNRGRNEAAKYYRGNKGLNTLTLLTSAVVPFIGLASAITTTAIPPSKRQLRLPDATLYAIPAYARGYQKKAGKIKAGRVWKNFGIGTAIFGFAYFSISRYR